MKYLFAMLRYHWRLLLWSWYIGYPSVYSLHRTVATLDYDSRRLIMDRWDREHAARKPQPPPLPSEGILARWIEERRRQ